MASSMSSNSSINVGPRASSNTDDDFPKKPLNSKDVGWQFGEYIKKGNYNEVMCLKCKRVYKGGINRIKQHIAGISGDVRPCHATTEEERVICKQNLEGIQKRKFDKKKAEYEIRQEVQISEERHAVEPELIQIGSKKRHVDGPLDKMVDSGKLKQTVINESEMRRRREVAHSYVAMFAYANEIPFHVFDFPEFHMMCEAIGRYGPGYKGPSQYQLRVPLLKQTCDKTEEHLQK